MKNLAGLFGLAFALLTALAIGEEPIPPGTVRYGNSLWPEGTLERIRAIKDGSESVDVIFVTSRQPGMATFRLIEKNLVIDVPIKKLPPADRKWVNDRIIKDKKLGIHYSYVVP